MSQITVYEEKNASYKTMNQTQRPIPLKSEFVIMNIFRYFLSSGGTKETSRRHPRRSMRRRRDSAKGETDNEKTNEGSFK